MDRQIVYTGAIPQTRDILSTNKSTMIGLGYALAAFLGPCSTPVVDGLAINPTLPASLSVTVGSGSIHASQPVDPNAYSDLGTDTAHTIVKQGILQDPVTLTVTAPGTAGYSQNYLVQVAFSEVDGGSLVLPYYNAANPSQPFAGPNNSGTSNFTVRQGTVVVQLKAGTAATTGSQTTPSPDAGYVGLYVITVANGATTVTSGNISTLATAPFIPTKLPTLPGDVQSGKWEYVASGGTANAWTLNPTPAVAARVAGRIFRTTVPATNTNTSVTVTSPGTPTCSLVKSDGTAPAVGDLVIGTALELFDDGSNLRVLTPLASDILNASARIGRMQVFTASGTFVVPAAVKAVWVRVIGGGAAGGGAPASTGVVGAGGGAAGGYAEKWCSVTPGQSVTVTVGSGGSANGAGFNGTAGGSSSFGAFCSASGGLGGAVNGNTNAIGGVGTGGDLNLYGSGGQQGTMQGTSPVGGPGGGPPFGGGSTSNSFGQGYDAQGYGAGGGGAGGTTQRGGVGAPGLVTVQW